ncbi:MAG: DNA repair protein RecN [Bacteroidota bacterium]
MIQRLLIKNYAIIEELEIAFSNQLTIITGETGAGKSILLGALGLIMGKRADTKALYKEDKKCVIEGQFDISHYSLKSFFDEHDIDYDEETVVRRELTPAGKSRAFINDTPVNLKTLQKLSSSLIDLHQQFDTRDINNISFQLRMLDALADNKVALEKYQKGFRQYQSDRRRLQNLIEQNDNSAREIEFLNFQINEFNEVELVEGEQKELEAELNRLTNAEEIKRTLGNATHLLVEGEQSVISNLEELSQAIGGIRNFHPRLDNIHDRYDGLIVELQDLSNELVKIAEDTEYDGERIAEAQARLDLIYKLQNKHKVNTLEELLQIQQDLQSQLNAFGDLSNEIEALEAQLQQQAKALQQIADDLSKRRQAVAAPFAKKVETLLSKLGMEYAQLRVEVNRLDALNATGIDEVQFLFAPNKGSKFMPIREVASGGELSRLTLCTKSLVASAIPLPTLIFDEIDTGISGDVALKMGNILQKLAQRHQVVSITHTPQIAVKADAHYFVYKSVREDRTVTNVKLLSAEERIKEVATMLSGSPPSDSAIENAKELLGAG